MFLCTNLTVSLHLQVVTKEIDGQTGPPEYFWSNADEIEWEDMSSDVERAREVAEEARMEVERARKEASDELFRFEAAKAEVRLEVYRHQLRMRGVCMRARARLCVCLCLYLCVRDSVDVDLFVGMSVLRFPPRNLFMHTLHCLRWPL